MERKSKEARNKNKWRTTTGKPASTASTAGNGTPSNPASGNENLTTRGKSLLPVRDDGRSTTRSLRLPQQPESRIAQRATRPPEKAQQHRQDQPPTPESTGITRRQSLIRPSPLKPSAPLKPTVTSTTPKRAAFAPSPSSPVKQETASRQNGRPLSPKKTDMPPPPARLARSASLRQPTASSSSTPTVTRGHARHRSQGVTLAPGPVLRKIESPSPSTTMGTRSRTQFTTYQQNFSPKKTSKPATTTPSVEAPAVNADPGLAPSAWPEIAALQTELLQLILVHSASLRQYIEWEAGAETQLRSEYDSVAGDYRAASNDEKEHQRRLNGQALHCWLQNSRGHNGHQGFAEQIQVLSQITDDVYNLSDNLGGRYTIVVQQFESWFQRVEDIRNHRLHHGQGSDQMVFIDPLDHTWRDEMSTLTMKLELCLRQLQSLDILGYGEAGPVDGSALFRTAKSLEEMVHLMVEEVNTIRKIESDVVKAERVWVSQLARQLTTVLPHDQKLPRVGVWRQPSFQS
ncbi:hypothetical protein BO70DRAFT_394977 [Aspergillus heteromorphus CBS 117.55]|uniref:Uncharacterized protein n=1 Tax=Aspergillus heteromorphus CBS 117.55 TaxID=1448321 RepID=A0A317WML4_9EURO|nr:uncharacterized protein BO70DRAFT_394977 [Aspergillus heteromorphus CBS 117.55]PWY86961.1 hypothetical protein BO70DRAFT_394977 [Aspergillus heteromorphus CBS 117.55]